MKREDQRMRGSFQDPVWLVAVTVCAIWLILVSGIVVNEIVHPQEGTHTCSNNTEGRG